MSWIFIFGLALIVFVNRYVFLEPNFTFKLPDFVERMLGYAAPCLMISICFPIIFYQGNEFRDIDDNMYLYGAIFTLVVVKYTKNMLLNIVLSLVFFYGLIYWLNLL